MTHRFPLSWPRPGSPARFPALLVPVLVAMAAMQLALPIDAPPPPAARVARRALPAVPAAPATVAVPPALRARPLFAPGATGHDPASGSPGMPSGIVADMAPPDPLGGARIAGSLREGGSLRAVVRRANGSIAYLRLGDRLGPWRLVALTAGQARFARAGGGGPALVIPFGTGAAASAPPAPPSDDQ